MIRVWFYCSYKGSSVGFRLGCVECADDGTPQTDFKSENADLLLERCFTYRGVYEAYGKLLGQDQYIVLRKMSHEKRKEDVFYLNLAFEIYDEKIYEALCTYMKKPYKEICEDISDSLKVDDANLEFGIIINKEKLKIFMENALSYKENQENLFDYFYVKANKGQKDLLIKKLELEDIYPNLYFSLNERPNEEGVFAIKAVKRSETNFMKAVILAVILLIFLIIVLIILI